MVGEDAIVCLHCGVGGYSDPAGVCGAEIEVLGMWTLDEDR